MTENQFFEKKGPFPLSKIAKVIGLANDLSSNQDLEIKSFETLDVAVNNDLTFLNSNKYQNLSTKTKASACITTSNLSPHLPASCIKLNVRNVLFAVSRLLR
mgnify:CR=1 FL=1